MKDIFTSIVDKIKQKAASWSTKLLSGAGKMIMLKSVLAAMPTYAMSCFKLPQSLCKRIQSALTRFWWDASPDKQKISWIAWEKMAKPKNLGGLGFKEINNFNDALLAKLTWRLLNYPKGLLGRTLMGKYGQDATLLECTVPGNASYGWKSLMSGRDLLIKQLGRVVGDGKDISVWNEEWLSTTEREQPMGPPNEDNKHMMVSDLIDRHTLTWNTEMIDQVLPSYKQRILSIKLSRLGARDKIIWLKNPSCEYTTKSGYYVAAEDKEKRLPNNTCIVDWSSTVWKAKAGPKIKIFLWKAIQGALPVGNQLVVRKVIAQSKCCKCDEPESICHMLFKCKFAQEVWQKAPFHLSLNIANIMSVDQGLEEGKKLIPLPPIGIEKGSLQAWICWTIWIARNQKIFNKRNFSTEEIILKAIQDAREWNLAQRSEPKPKDPNLKTSPRNGQQERDNLIICHTDAAWWATSEKAGLGWSFRLNKTEKYDQKMALENVSSVLIAEASAIREAILQHKGWESKIF